MASASGVAESAEAPPPATAEQPPPPVVVMVDMQQLIYGSHAGKDVQAQMDTQRQAFSRQVAREEDELHKAQADLDRQQGLLVPDTMEARSRDLQRRVEELDHSVKSKQQAWQQAYNNAMNKVEDVALDIVKDIARSQGANLVIQKTAVIFSKDGFDITADALARLDRQLPTVTVELQPLTPASTANPPVQGDAADPFQKSN